MLNFKLAIDEQEIKRMIEEQISKQIVSEHYTYIGNEAKHGVRQAIEKATKEYIYSIKDEIIEKVIERASVEVVKKSVLKIVETIQKGEK